MKTTFATGRGQWRRGLVAVLVGTIALGGGRAHPAFAVDSHRTITVFTANIDSGTQFTFLLAATTPDQFLAAVAATYGEVVAGRPDERAAALAREIAAAQPSLVAL